jgi:hypothetical protein
MASCSREDEIALAKRIEAAQQAVLAELAKSRSLASASRGGVRNSLKAACRLIWSISPLHRAGSNGQATRLACPT